MIRHTSRRRRSPTAILRPLGIAVAFVMLVASTAAAATKDGQTELPPLGFVDGEVLVKFNGDFPSQSQRSNFAAETGLTESSFAPEINWFTFTIADDAGLHDKVRQLNSHPSVELATENVTGALLYIPNDPGYPEQWGLPIVGMPEAWDLAGGGSTRYTAIVDTGVDIDHPDLGFIYGWNFVNNTADINDYQNHGTMAAGIAGAFTGNATGMAGINYSAPIMSAVAVGLNGVPDVGAAAEAIRYAANNGASAINASWYVVGSEEQLQPLKDAVDYAYAQGSPVVAGTTNDGLSNFDGRAPAMWATAVAVGGTTPSDLRWPSSNYGTPGVDVSAPSESIYSSWNTGGYGYASGTSFAAPFVTGTIGLMVERYPNLTGAEIKQRLWDSADKVGGYNYSWTSFCGGQSAELGCGRLNAADAVR